MATPTTTSFLLLPAELRLQIYGYMLDSISGIPTVARLQEYRGLLLSCREIYLEIETEALKIINAFAGLLQTNWTLTADRLHIPVISKLSDTVTIYIGVPGEVRAFASELVPVGGFGLQRRPYASIQPLIDSLIATLPCFGLYMRDDLRELGSIRHFAYYAQEYFPATFTPESLCLGRSEEVHYGLDKNRTVVLYDAEWREGKWMGRKVFDPLKER